MKKNNKSRLYESAFLIILAVRANPNKLQVMGENLKTSVLLAAMHINPFVVWHKAVIDSAAFCADNMIMRIRIPIKMFHFVIGKKVRDNSDRKSTRLNSSHRT